VRASIFDGIAINALDVTAEPHKPPVRYQYQPELGDNHYVELPVDPHGSVGS